MTIQELYKLIRKECPGARLHGRCISNENDHVLHVPRKIQLPENVSIYFRGCIQFDFLHTIPSGVWMSTGFNLYLSAVEIIDPDVWLSAKWNIYLEGLTRMSENVSIRANGGVSLIRLIEICDGVSIHTKTSLELERVTKISPSVSLHSGYWINLNSIAELPEGVSISSNGAVYLNSLTKLPKRAELSGRMIYLPSLESPHQRYNGEDLYLETFDCITTQRLSTPRKVGDCEVYEAAAFNGRGTGKRYCIARLGEHAAHGETTRDAINNVNRLKLRRESAY